MTSVRAQMSCEIHLLPEINTGNDEIACAIINGELVYMTSEEIDLVNDYLWSAKPMFHLMKAKRGDTFSNWSPSSKMFDSHQQGDQGPATFNPRDSTLYFCSPENFGEAVGSCLKIYSVKMTETGWGDPHILPFCTTKSDYTHPYYDASEGILVFSSNRAGGFGKMDIWFTNQFENGWTEPVNPGMMVNSPSNEIFPTIFQGDIYYSSDLSGGIGGYDIRKAIRSQQWKTSETLGEPYNSVADDISVYFINEDKALLTSNRLGGIGGDDIYILERKILNEEFHDYTAVFETEGKPNMGVTIAAMNEYGELVMTQRSDSSGHVDIHQLLLNHNYRLQLADIDPSMYKESVLVIYDHDGNKIRELRFNMNGFADLELLPLNYSALNLLPLDDQSLLTLNIEGQLYDENPGDIGRGEPVTILDEIGNPVAIAYTNDNGKFRFTKVEPHVEYTFRLSTETAATNVLITDKGEKITLPVLDAEVRYTRINPGEAIELINEYNEKITVSLKDVFVINRIYYEYNSTLLTAEAKRQLDQLKIIMERNQQVGLELRSHTDSRGNDTYNLNLSEKRAGSAISYLVESGLRNARFKAIGLGETQLINECDDNVPCSDPEHSINRRTEIKLAKL